MQNQEQCKLPLCHKTCVMGYKVKVFSMNKNEKTIGTWSVWKWSGNRMSTILACLGVKIISRVSLEQIFVGIDIHWRSPRDVKNTRKNRLWAKRAVGASPDHYIKGRLKSPNNYLFVRHKVTKEWHQDCIINWKIGRRSISNQYIVIMCREIDASQVINTLAGKWPV